MLNVNPSNSQKLARTIQRDYQQAAESHRRRNQHHEQGGAGLSIKLTLLIAMLAITFVTITQFVM